MVRHVYMHGLAAIVLLGTLLLIACARSDTVDGRTTLTSLADRIEMFEDLTATASLADITSLENPVVFERRPGPLNLGVTKSAFWFHLDLEDRDFANDFGRWVISLAPQFEGVTAYAKSDAADAPPWRELPLAEFARRHTAFAAFELPDRPAGTMRLLFRAQTSNTLFFAPRLLAGSRYVEERNAENLRKGAYYGIVIGAIVYNLFLAIWLRERSYALYVVFEAAYCLTVSCMDRTLIAVFPSLLSAVQHGLTERLMCITGIVAVLFARDFLDLRASRSVLVATLVAVVAVLPLLAISESDGRQLLYAAAYVFIIYTSSLVSFMAVLSWRRGNANAVLFSIAWGTVLLATTIGSLSNLGMLMPTYNVIGSLQLGSGVEAMILSIALARRMNLIKRAEEHARTELGEARLRLSQTLQRQITSLNTLVGGVAHEIGNPLNFATGGAQDVVQRIHQADALAAKIAESSTADRASSLRSVLEAAGRSAALAARGMERIDSIVKNLRTYVGTGAQPLESTDLDNCIRSTVTMLDAHLQDKHIEVSLELGIECRVRCCPSEMNQVIMNLVLNATQAMPDGGTIFIRSEETTDALRIVVADTGPGVPPALRQSIFDPFFTTRAPNEGTGLGLAVSTEIARRHGGSLELLPAHDQGRGAAFVIHLPRPRP